MNTWQPIETAPKDGTPVLMWDPDDARPRVAWWLNNIWAEGWCVGGHRSGTELISPTHWMPLPEPPKEEVE